MHHVPCGAVIDLEAMHAVEPHAVGLGAIGRQVAQRRVPFLATHRAGMATDAGVEID